MLSGGLDSSAITCTARALRGDGAPPLDTFSFVFDEVRASDERPYIEAVLAGGNVRNHTVRGDRLDPLHDIDRLLTHLGEPTWAGNLFLHDAVWAQARAAGVRVLLDGFFGDSAVGYGDERLTELAARGRLGAWGREALAGARRSGGGRRLALAFALDSLRPLVPHVWPIGTKGAVADPLDSVAVPLAPPYADRAAARHRGRSAPRYRTVRRAQAADLASGTYPLMFELLDKGAAAHGVEVRLPFADRRLVELSLAFPSALKLRDGYDRWILRRSLGGRLPERVRWRAGKGDLSPNFVRALATRGRARLAREVADPAGPLAPYLDRPGVEGLLRRLDAGDADAAGRLWTAAGPAPPTFGRS
jgi:asparagine synthase (glutamine-hydrolysing)